MQRVRIKNTTAFHGLTLSNKTSSEENVGCWENKTRICWQWASRKIRFGQRIQWITKEMFTGGLTRDTNKHPAFCVCTHKYYQSCHQKPTLEKIFPLGRVGHYPEICLVFCINKFAIKSDRCWYEWLYLLVVANSWFSALNNIFVLMVRTMHYLQILTHILDVCWTWSIHSGMPA